jgi:hypothetical protein
MQLNRRWLVLLAVLTACMIFWIADYFARPPYGIVSQHLLFSQPKIGPAVPCTWDYEASWAIGTTTLGTALHRLELRNATLFACHDVSVPAVSFVADPMAVRIRSTTDWTPCAEDVDGRSSSSRPEGAPASEGAAAAGSGECSGWAVLLEMKNVASGLGEIGAAVCGVDESDGVSPAGCRFVGTALSESFHLSFPHVLYDARRQRWLMIPESKMAGEVRVYGTTVDAFPLGWTLEAVKLRGLYVDTSAAFLHGRWWIFSTDSDYSLRVFCAADDLVEDDWVEHMASPVVLKSRRLGRSAGPVRAYDGYLWRFAQDCSRFYGDMVRLIRVDIDLAEYHEELVREWVRPAAPHFGAERFHHVDAHRLPDGRWIAVVDGDVHPDDYQFWIREGDFVALKRALALVMAVLWLVAARRVAQGIAQSNLAARGVFPAARRTASQVLLRVAIAGRRLARALLAPRTVVLAALWLVAFVALLAACFPLFALLRGLQYDSRAALLARPTPLRQEFLLAHPDIVMVTAASHQYMARLRNFVGSMHVWEPEMPIVVYDLGLHEEDRIEMACWRGVTVRRLDWAALPAHFQMLFNFAWKMAVIVDSLRHASAVIVLDAGAEIRRPLDGILLDLHRRGYWIASQSNYLGVKSANDTLSYFGLERREVLEFQFCAGGLQAYVRGHPAQQRLVNEIMDCAMDLACIAPPGSGRENHNFDQSAVSSAVYRGGFTCSREVRYIEYRADRVPAAIDAASDTVILLRRWHTPRPFEDQIVHTCDVPTQDMVAPAEPTVLVEHGQGAHYKADSALLQCVRQHDGDVSKCTELANGPERLTFAMTVDNWLFNLRGVLFRAYSLPLSLVAAVPLAAAAFAAAFEALRRVGAVCATMRGARAS